jgi:Ca2+-binding RTX toxin-like protein
MATVYWPNLEKGYDHQTQRFRDYGFDIKYLLVPDAADPFFVSKTGFDVVDASPYGAGTVGDSYTGTFVVKDVHIVEGTINSFVRQPGGDFVGSITGLQISFKDLSAAAATDDKSDDIALWAQAFSGDDSFTGTNTADRLQGFSGNDKLYGRYGNDILSGGLGLDVFVFNSKLGTSETDRKLNFDSITDFNVRDDSIWLDNAVFKKLGSGTPTKPKMLNKAFFVSGDKAKDSNDYLVYNKKTGVLSYDADGNGSKAAIEVAKFNQSPKLAYNDFFII